MLNYFIYIIIIMNNNTPNLPGSANSTTNITKNKQISNTSKLNLDFKKKKDKIANDCSAAIDDLDIWLSSGSPIWEQEKSRSAFVNISDETTIIKFTRADEARLNELLSKKSLTRSERKEKRKLMDKEFNYSMTMGKAEIAQFQNGTSQLKADTAQKRDNIA